MKTTTHAKTVRIGLMACLLAVIAPLAKAEPTIDFSSSHNLKAVYDAGLRPWRFNPNERGSLNLTDQKLSVITPGGGRFSMDTQIGSLIVLTGYELSSADFTSQPMLLEDAAVLLREVALALDVDINVGAKMESFEVKLDQIKQFPKLRKMPPPHYWNGQGVSGGFRTGVTFYPLFGIIGQSPIRANVTATIKFDKPGVIPKFFDRPLTPPPGYEHMSMEKPPRDPNQKGFPEPTPSVQDYLRAAEVPKQTTVAPTAGAEAVTTPAPEPPPAPVPVVSPPAKSSNPLWWVVGALAALAAVVLVVRRKKPKV